jgi:imidazolonepropionase-like amidohydrolase
VARTVEEGEEVGQTELSAAELQALTSEAHRFGRKIAAHALGTAGIANAVHAGVDTISVGLVHGGQDQTVEIMGADGVGEGLLLVQGHCPSSRQ